MNDSQQNAPPARADYDLYLGLEVYGDTVVAAHARPGRKPAEILAQADNTEDGLARLAREAAAANRGALLWCCEAGASGNALQRRLQDLGQECGLAEPRPRWVRTKWGRRDAKALAKELRDDRLEPRPLWVSEQEREKMYALWDACSFTKSIMLRVARKLNGHAQRCGHCWPADRKRWTPEHFSWLEGLEFADETDRLIRDRNLEQVRYFGKSLEEEERCLLRLRREWCPGPRPGEAPERDG